jgi:hypothetical protein
VVHLDVLFSECCDSLLLIKSHEGVLSWAEYCGWDERVVCTLLQNLFLGLFIDQSIVNSVGEKCATLLCNWHKLRNVLEDVANRINVVDTAPFLFFWTTLNLSRAADRDPCVCEAQLLWLSVSTNGHQNSVDLNFVQLVACFELYLVKIVPYLLCIYWNCSSECLDSILFHIIHNSKGHISIHDSQECRSIYHRDVFAKSV